MQIEIKREYQQRLIQGITEGAEGEAKSPEEMVNEILERHGMTW